MAINVKITSRPADGIRHAGPAVRSVSSGVIAKALGVEKTVSRENVLCTLNCLHSLRLVMGSRVRSTGGLWRGNQGPEDSADA